MSANSFRFSFQILTLLAVALLLTTAGTVRGQGLTGQISGAVRDSSSAAVADAKVELTNQDTGQVREGSTDALGEFVFVELLRGTYKVRVIASGFKQHEQGGIILTATERLVLRPVVLEIGTMIESVSVTSATAKVQTQSMERSGLLTESQLVDTPVKGRSLLSMIRLLPGVVDTGDIQAPSDLGTASMNINGARGASINMTYDGISSLDTGGMNGPQMTPPLESVSEVKVLLSNYQAEYGRSSGGTINIVTKGGSKEFHGGAYYFKRNDALNANSFFNNKNGVKRGRYRYDYPGYFVGGPVLIPWINRTREKLFFFWSEDFVPQTIPSSLNRKTFPTTLERQGNFSQTVDTNGAMIVVRDPLNGQPLSGNIIPADRFDANGKTLLGLFPLPNAADPAHNYNYLYQTTSNQPHRTHILRVDWNPSPSTTFYVRGALGYDNSKTTGSPWPSMPTQQERFEKALVATLIHTFRPTLINETTFGVNRRYQLQSPSEGQSTLGDYNRTKLGFNLPEFHPEINPLSLIPNMGFGGVPNAPNASFEARFPFYATNNIWNFTDNLSKVYGTHNLKTGIYFEKTSRNTMPWWNGAFNGSFDFGRNSNNPLDSNYAYSNALLGVVAGYSEADARPLSNGRYWNVEWFAQDSWKVSRNLTLDLGVRFYAIKPTFLDGNPVAVFDPTKYDPAKAPKLLMPYIAPSSNQRKARNPVTGQVLPAALIGALAPGSGDYYNGMVVSKETVWKTPHIQVAPRIGFAWDVFGNGKTALRGGIGVFPDRSGDDRSSDALVTPPLVNVFNAYYTTMKDLLVAPYYLTPNSTLGVQSDYQVPVMYNWSFGVQRDIGWGTVVDVAYVGSTGRHLQQQRSLNSLPYGTNFKSSSIDSTVTGNKPLPTNFLRPYVGYGDIIYDEFSASSNYHSMQTQVHRRFTKNLTLGAVWTWAKNMTVTDGYDMVNPNLPSRMRNYDKAYYDRTHTFVLSYSYSLPKFSQHWNNIVSRSALDNWEVAGVTSFVSGTPVNLNYSLVNAFDITGAGGAGVDSRVNLICNPNLSHGDKTATRAINTACVRPPDAATFGIGNAPRSPYRNPGTNNWDISVYKNFPFGKEGRRYLQFRHEMYNAFNHTQFSEVDRNARFDAAGNQVNTNFGWMTATRSPRIIQLGAKFYF